jgi:hypothetical protein
VLFATALRTQLALAPVRLRNKQAIPRRRERTMRQPWRLRRLPIRSDRRSPRPAHSLDQRSAETRHAWIGGTAARSTKEVTRSVALAVRRPWNINCSACRTGPRPLWISIEAQIIPVLCQCLRSIWPVACYTTCRGQTKALMHEVFM